MIYYICKDQHSCNSSSEESCVGPNNDMKYYTSADNNYTTDNGLVKYCNYQESCSDNDTSNCININGEIYAYCNSLLEDSNKFLNNGIVENCRIPENCESVSEYCENGTYRCNICNENHVNTSDGCIACPDGKRAYSNSRIY